MAARPTFLSRFVRRVLIALYRLRGWKITGHVPPDRKFVIAGAPHSSNWDFAIFLGAVDQLGVRPSYIGKRSLFRWPLKRFMLDMGGIPIDRTKRANYVDQVVAEFDRHDELALVIAPEGTRHSDGRWKSGFYHIALGAGVPIVLAWIDRKRRIGHIGPVIHPTGDYRADITRIAEHFRAAWPEQPRFREIDREAPDKPALSKQALHGQSDAP